MQNLAAVNAPGGVGRGGDYSLAELSLFSHNIRTSSNVSRSSKFLCCPAKYAYFERGTLLYTRCG